MNIDVQNIPSCKSLEERNDKNRRVGSPFTMQVRATTKRTRSSVQFSTAQESRAKAIQRIPRGRRTRHLRKEAESCKKSTGHPQTVFKNQEG